MDSPLPSTSTSDSCNRSDARNGKGLAIDEIMRMKEKRLRLLDDYRNEQEDSILPLMREADDISRKRKKKSRTQFPAESNIPLRRSERIMTQTLNENGTIESPMDQSQLEPDTTSEPQHEPEFEPEPAQREEFEPELVFIDDSEPEPAQREEFEPELIFIDDSEPEPELADDSEPEPALADDSEPEPALVDDSEPEPALIDDSEPEPALVDDSEPEPALADDAEPEPALVDDVEPEPAPADDAEPEPALADDFELEPALLDNFDLESIATNISEPESLLMNFSQQGARSRRRNRSGNRNNRSLTETWRPTRRFYDIQLASRRVFAVYPVPGRGYPPYPRGGLRYQTFNETDNLYGPREGFDIGYHWNTRLECSHDKVHRPSIAGIHAGPLGAYSVALSGAYPDDIDRGNMVVFTGAGGRDLRGSNGRSRSVRSAPQVRDQELNKANMSLIRSVRTGTPVRLIRGYKLASSYAPARGYRYDGLYRVVHFSYGRGHSGFRVFKFEMYRLQNQRPPPWETAPRVEVPRRSIAPFPRNPTPPPSTSAVRPRRRPRARSSRSRDIAILRQLYEEIEGYIRILSQDPFYIPNNDNGNRFAPFRGFNDN